MRTIEPQISEYDNKTPYWICPRFGETLYERNIRPNRKCPSTKHEAGPIGCKEGCYFKPYAPDEDRKKKSTKSKSKRKITKKGCGCK